jgi:hypothetical protein
MRISPLLIQAGAALFFTGLVFVQPIKAQQAADKLAQAMTDSMGYLSLTDQQKSTAAGLNKTAATSLTQLAQKAKQDTTLKGKALFQQVMGIMKQRNAGLTKILSPDQQKLFGQHRVEQIADLQTKMMATQLKLTDDQIPKVYQVNLKATGEMMEDMQKVQEARGKLKKMRGAKGLKSTSADKDKELKQILTPDQYEVYEKNKEAQQAAIKEKMNEKKG